MQQHKFVLKINNLFNRVEIGRFPPLTFFLCSLTVLNLLIRYRQLYTAKYLPLSQNWCESSGSVVLDCKNFPISLPSECNEDWQRPHSVSATCWVWTVYGGVEWRDKQPAAHRNARSMKLASLVKAEATIQNMHMPQNCKGKLLGWLINEINVKKMWFSGDQRGSPFVQSLLMLEQIAFT